MLVRKRLNHTLGEIQLAAMVEYHLLHMVLSSQDFDLQEFFISMAKVREIAVFLVS